MVEPDEVEELTRLIAATRQPESSAQKHATDTLAKLVWPRIQRIAILELRRSWSWAGSWDMAEDVATDTYLIFMRYAHNIDPVKLDGWIRVVVRHNIIRRKQRQRKETPTELPPDYGYSTYCAPGSIEWQLRVEVRQLPRALQQVLYLRYWRDMKVEEVAETLDVVRGTVQYRLRHALARLHQALTGAEDGHRRT